MTRLTVSLVALMICGGAQAAEFCPIQPGAVVCTDHKAMTLVASLFPNSSNFEAQKAKALATGHCWVNTKLTPVVARNESTMAWAHMKNEHYWTYKIQGRKGWVLVSDNFVFNDSGKTGMDACGVSMEHEPISTARTPKGQN